ncbi:MAG: hypothetical protein HN985_01310, partial [Planctomycetaceae bacterium]|nr:hypothetical protein [Planctomycetaceae bacterium]
RTTTLNPDRKGSTDSFANKAFSTISNAVRGKYDVEESSEAAPSEVQQKDTLWVMKPDGEIGGPFTKQYLRELKVSGKLPQGLTASRSKNGPWQKIS